MAMPNIFNYAADRLNISNVNGEPSACAGVNSGFGAMVRQPGYKDSERSLRGLLRNIQT
jgi:hypothetical protein